MVQIIQNWADVEGRVLSVRADASRPGYNVASIELGTVHDVASFPNLLNHSAGESVDVLVPEAMLGPEHTGRAVRCRLRRARPTEVFAHTCEVA